MAPGTTAVALAVRAHPRAASRSGTAEISDALSSAAARIGEESPALLAGPSTLSADGTLVLVLSEPKAILQAILEVADRVRPIPTTFSAAVRRPRDGGRGPGSGHSPVDRNPVSDKVMAAGAATSVALSWAAETDPAGRRVIVGHEEPDGMLGSLIELVLLVYDGMTDRQRQIVSLARSSETQQQVASHLDISRQAVNQSLAAAGWKQLRRAEEAILARLGRGPAAGP